jgi:hypothetical protein
MPTTYEKIQSTTLGSASSTITFSSIPATYTDLRLVVVASTTGTSDYNMALRFNGDTSGTYSRMGFDAAGGNTIYNFTNVNQTYIDWVYAHGANPTPSLINYDIFSYAGSTYKTTLVTASHDTNTSGPTALGRIVALWRNTAAITSIELSFASTNFAIGTIATIYGIKAA